MLEEISMAWNRRYSWASSLRSSLWVVPLSALALEFALKRLAEMLGNWMLGQGWYNLHTGYFGVNATEAHAILDRIFALNVTCLVFAFASLLVAIQVAGGQYTPRIIATTLLRNNVISGIIGLFLFTMIWAHRTMLQLGQSNVVPQLQVFLASVFGLCSLIAFVVLIDYCAKFLRPVSLVNQVGEQGIAVIESMYPQPFRDAPDEDPAPPAGPPDRVINHEGHSGVVLEFCRHGRGRTTRSGRDGIRTHYGRRCRLRSTTRRRPCSPLTSCNGCWDWWGGVRYRTIFSGTEAVRHASSCAHRTGRISYT
jgi:uncharacterized membrane protein